MKSKLLACCLGGLVAGACQPSDFVDPSDDPTGNAAPPDTQVFAYSAEQSPRFLGANLEQTNALQAEFTVAGGVLVPMQEGGAFPSSTGADANLQGGVGFGTYANPDRGSNDWAGSGDFMSILESDIVLSQPGDAVKFCRSFATTCAEVRMVADGAGVVVLSLAANVPDTELGEIQPGISAAIRGTGDSGLTIALTAPEVVSAQFAAAAGTPLTLSWTIARGDEVGTLDYAVSIDGQELLSGNTSSQLAASIVTQGGVGLIFDAPIVTDVRGGVDFSYQVPNFTPTFSNVYDTPVDLSPRLGLGFAPLYVYPTQDPDLDAITLSGEEGSAHSVQAEDGVLGVTLELPGIKPKTTIYSASFDGDDFAETRLAGEVDLGIEGGGFYPSPSFCYSQIYPQVEAKVEAGVRAEVLRKMYASIAEGAAVADGALFQLSQALQGEPFNLPESAVGYTRLGDLGGGDLDGYIALGTDYAVSNVDTNITTSVQTTYEVTFADPASETFVAQLNGIIGALEANNNQIRDALIGNGALTLEDFQNLKRLQAGLTTPRGSKDGVTGPDGSPIQDGNANCNGYDCNVSVILRDQIAGGNASGLNAPIVPGEELTPVLPHACLWGLPGSEATEAQPAVLNVDGDIDNDRPAIPAAPATPATPPVREVASASMNTLVQGIYENFVGQAFGLTVPASNFSLSMKVGDTTTGTAPGVSRIVISSK
ncbi:hypothetical protein [Haliangium ochraceum]|uniref:Lipoprotein n=1 Tax=Haliangium ochraceum (strain DSM 14365 / JCM 11303 / SMP-2) TaxID=502025 RepID=D0LRV7_HALO1|nr:hypothetical protein [Haliangium ochraceum]ACY19099.1 hypothetical protein Hoch_6633 [Haliangium ochraceum DSM 14365]